MSYIPVVIRIDFRFRITVTFRCLICPRARCDSDNQLKMLPYDVRPWIALLCNVHNLQHNTTLRVHRTSDLQSGLFIQGNNRRIFRSLPTICQLQTSGSSLAMNSASSVDHIFSLTMYQETAGDRLRPRSCAGLVGTRLCFRHKSCVGCLRGAA